MMTYLLTPAPSRVSMAPVMLSRVLSEHIQDSSVRGPKQMKGGDSWGLGGVVWDSSREPNTMLLRRKKKTLV